MKELIDITQAIQMAFDFTQMIGFDQLLPMAGVGGGMEAKETVDVAPLIKFSLVFLGSVGALFGLGLALAAKRFAVSIDPRIEQVKDVLAGAHCGACGYPGCEQYAEAVVKNADVPPNLCTPGGSRAIEAVARITGKMAEDKEPEYSRIMCQGGHSKSTRRFMYEGVTDCRAAILAGGGDKSCVYGCLGYGTCVSVCPFDAIHMGEDGLPLVNIRKCTGCKKCAVACPKNVIEIVQASRAVLVACHSKDKGGVSRKMCEVSCIACGKCVKVCPYDAPKIENNLSVIDTDKCQVCGLCVPACPTDAIVDFIPVRPKAFITDECNGCHKCAKICPVEAASGEQKQKHEIDQTKCTGCGICVSNCAKLAIEGAFNFEVVAEAAAKKKADREAAKAKAESDAA